MSKYELSKRAADWLALALALVRGKRDNECYGGGDENHRNEQAGTWRNVALCQKLLKEL